ncbi:MAG: nucleotidyltransferase domain-containing protein [bacterium]|nr:nucleotidyltransferase domain-containing protein [bacterium]
MTKNTAVQVIRDIFALKEVKIEKVLFFGSRARGVYNKESDWDFLVVADKQLAFKEKHRLIVQIKRKLAKLGIPNDIIIQSRSKFDSMKNYPGNISYVANLVGVPA